LKDKESNWTLFEYDELLQFHQVNEYINKNGKTKFSVYQNIVRSFQDWQYPTETKHFKKNVQFVRLDEREFKNGTIASNEFIAEQKTLNDISDIEQKLKDFTVNRHNKRCVDLGHYRSMRSEYNSKKDSLNGYIPYIHIPAFDEKRRFSQISFFKLSTWSFASFIFENKFLKTDSTTISEMHRKHLSSFAS
jgi:hypothetical protein